MNAKPLTLVLLALCALACCCGIARADTSYCAAHVAKLSPWQQDQHAPAQSYVVELTAARDADLHGVRIIFDTSAGWYSTLLDHPVSPADTTFQSQYGRFTERTFQTGPIPVNFPTALTVITAYVADVNDAPCSESPMGLAPIIGLGLPKDPFVHDMGDLQVVPPAKPIFEPSGDAVWPATAIPAPGSLDCEEPFEDAYITAIIPPAFPGPFTGYGGETFLEAAISADGKLQDSWIFASSGYAPYDDAALRSLRSARFVPARAFCQNVPSLYLFRAQFRA